SKTRSQVVDKHDEGVASLAISNDGRYLAAGVSYSWERGRPQTVTRDRVVVYTDTDM
ncbi:hypothetical protein KIPB_002405, partial [Kipferlia bialata]